VPLDPSAIGRQGSVVTYDIDASEVRAFADAIGDPSAVYRDLDAARAAGHPAIPAPPTFAACRRGGDDVREGLDMDWSRILHGSEEVELRRPVYVGDRLHVSQRVADVFTKEGRSGVMDFLVLEAVAPDDAGELVYTVKRTVVVKRRPDEGAP